MSQLNDKKKWTSKRMENNKEKDGKKTKPDTKKNNKNRNTRNNFKNNRKRTTSEKTITVKMTNLPEDITVKELHELILPWGHIGNINFGKSSYKIAYIDFYKKDEADYFVKALDRTPFDQLIIGVEIA